MLPLLLPCESDAPQLLQSLFVFCFFFLFCVFFFTDWLRDRRTETRLLAAVAGPRRKSRRRWPPSSKRESFPSSLIVLIFVVEFIAGLCKLARVYLRKETNSTTICSVWFSFLPPFTLISRDCCVSVYFPPLGCPPADFDSDFFLFCPLLFVCNWDHLGFYQGRLQANQVPCSIPRKTTFAASEVPSVD